MATSCTKVCASKLCKERKACACECEARFALNPVAVDACIADCWDDPNLHSRYTSVEDYLCTRFDAQDLFNRQGYICPGFDPMTGTVQGQVYQEQKSTYSEQNSQSNKLLMIAAVVALLILVYYFYLLYQQ